MNSSQLEDYLTDLITTTSKSTDKGLISADDHDAVRKFLARNAPNTLFCVQYLSSNYTDVDVVQPIVAQLLALYYKGGVLRLYSLQYVPALIATYLLALSKKQHKSVSVFETFFLAVYNEEILAGGPNSGTMTKKVEEVRIPSIRYPSIYHDPVKISALPEITTLKLGGAPNVQTTVRIGPYPTIERFTAQNKFLVLARLLKAINSSVCRFSSEVVSRHVCLCALSITQSGFPGTRESKFRARVLDEEPSTEILEDFSKRPRQLVSSSLLCELLAGCHLALFHGQPDLALRAIDGIHERAQYEMMPEVLMMTNCIRNQLLENPLSKERREELMWQRGSEKHREKKRKDMVTNASLRLRKMPEDIPVLEQEQREHSHSFTGKLEEMKDDLHESMDHLKKKMSSLSHHHHRNKKKRSGSDGGGGGATGGGASDEGIGAEDIELQPINEEARGENGDDLDASVPRPVSLEHCESNGSFVVNGLRHMDSEGSTHRSID